MSNLFNKTSKETFLPFEFDKESDFEKIVVELSEQIFGEESIYLNIKKKVRGGDITTIPDGYVLDLADPMNPSLYIIENEIVSHDPFKHIGIQLLKFATSFDDGKQVIRNFLMEEISKNDLYLKKLENACSNSQHRNIDNFLDIAVFKKFKAIVVIDEARPELHNVLEKINADISVIELKTFINSKNEFIHLYDTVYDENEDEVSKNKDLKTYSAEDLVKKRARRAKCDTIVVPAREEGFNDVFLGQNKWYAIRIGAAMKDKIKYIAAYQKSPISSITYIAKVKDIRPYQNTNKYEVIFDGAAQKIGPIKLKDSKMSPQCPVYVEYSKLQSASSIDELLEY